MKTILETERLVAREFLPSDAPLIFKLNSDPKVIKYTGDKPCKNEEEAQQIIEEKIIAQQYLKDGFGRWAVHLKSNGLFIGWCGLRKLEPSQEIDLGYRFLARFWGKGYATEIAKATIDYGFNNLGLSRIIGRTMPENIASITVLEKLGMKIDKPIECNGLPSVKYIIEK